MALREISIALIGLTLATLGSCDFDYPRFRSFGFADSLGSADSVRSSWFSSPGSDGFIQSEPSRIVPHYSGLDSYPFDSLKHGTDHIPAFKKIPTEDKTPKKKPVPPFYTLPDDPKIKEILLKSGAPYCQEITPKDSRAGASASSKAGVDEKQMTCYRCKDPKNGSTYEHCSYTSQPSGSSSSTREPRSNAAAEKSPDSIGAGSHPRAKSSHGSDEESTEKLPEAFRFSDDYFHPEASHELPAEYEKNIDNCERVVKDSMVCMVCKDPKTSGKYEQCSYVAQPNEKAYAYSKSSSFGGAKAKPRDEALKDVIKKQGKKQPEESRHRPRKHDSDEEEEHEEHEEPENHKTSEEHNSGEHGWEGHGDDKEGHHSHYVPEHTYHYPSYKDYKPSSYGSYESGDEAEEAPKQSANTKSNCKTVQKDGQSCTVCTNPKTGGKSEQCAYSHEPKDKVYKYSKSKSFGYPESANSKSKSKKHSGDEEEEHEERSPESTEKQEQREASSGESFGYGSYESEPSTLDYIRSESEKISKQVKGKGDCRQVKRDDEVCTICKDPKTGGENEQCNYSYEPEDKVFAYSKSKSFGSPTKSSSSSDDEYGGSSASEEHPEETYSSPVIYPTGTSPLDYIPKSSESQLSSVYTTRRPQNEGESQDDEKQQKKPDRVDHGFYDATLRRAEIEKIVKDIGSEDRSKCKKMYRNGMTCYSCADEQGFVNEECVFVNEPESTEASGTVEVTVKPTTASSSTTVSTTTSSTTTTTKQLLEPLQTSSSWRAVQMTKRKTRATSEDEKSAAAPKDKDEELEVLDEELDEAEPYDYVAETRPVYDKVLGITLPAYMLTKSAQEAEFDEYVEKAKF